MRMLPLVLLTVCLMAPHFAHASAAQCGYTVLAQHPHDATAFTQGLFVHQGKLYETTGRYGQSSLRQVDVKTGRVEKRLDLPATVFGEGGVAVGEEAVVLTWKAGAALRVNLGSFETTGKHAYAGQGWGLTHDGQRLIMSSGDSELVFRDPETFAFLGRVPVGEGKMSVPLLNELEYVHGRVLANVWLSAKVAIINPKSGQVTGWLDLSPLAAKAAAMGAKSHDAVTNGLAWDPERERLYATGKLWPVLFELELAPCAAYAQQGAQP